MPTTVQSWSRRLVVKRPGSPAGVGRKLPRTALGAYLLKHSDAYQAEVAAHFGVARFAVRRGLQQLGLSRKKNVATSKDKYTR